MESFFLKRNVRVIVTIAVIVVATAWASVVCNFDLVKTIVDFPDGVAYFLPKFLKPMEEAEFWKVFGRCQEAIVITLFDAVSASTIAAALAYLFALIASREVGLAAYAPKEGASQSAWMALSSAVTLAVRIFATFMRNIPVVAWAFILIVAFYHSEFAGWLALGFKSFGFLTRTFLETIDDVNPEPLEALRAAGATNLQQIAHVIVPMSMTQVISWLLYQMDANIRDAMLVGMLTGAGVGYLLEMYYSHSPANYPAMGMVIVFVVVAVIVIEIISNYVRRRII